MANKTNTYLASEASGIGANGKGSFTEGLSTIASGKASHAEGYHTETSNSNEHAQGKYNLSVKSDVPSEATQFSIGQGTSNEDRSNLVEVKKDGSMYVKGVGDFDGKNYDTAKSLQEEMKENEDVVIRSICDLNDNLKVTDLEHRELIDGINEKINDFSLENGTGKGSVQTKRQHIMPEEAPELGLGPDGEDFNGGKASGIFSSSEGMKTSASGLASHAEGDTTTSIGHASHSEGNNTIASGANSHAEGLNEYKASRYSVVGGKAYLPLDTKAILIEFKNPTVCQNFVDEAGRLNGSGYNPVLIFLYKRGSFATGIDLSIPLTNEGSLIRQITLEKEVPSDLFDNISASNEMFVMMYKYGSFGDNSHTGGDSCTAYGKNSQAYGDHTITKTKDGFATGSYNISLENEDKSISTQFSIGDGASEQDRSNLLEIKKDGSMYVKGVGGFNGNNSKGGMRPEAKSLQEAILENPLNMENGAGKGSMQTKGQHLTEEDVPGIGPGGLDVPGGTASGILSHAEGTMSIASGDFSHAEGNSEASGNASHAEGVKSVAEGSASHAEGAKTTALGEASHAEGISTNTIPSDLDLSTATNDDIINKWNTTKFSLAKGYASHVSGTDCLALSDNSFAAGNKAKSLGIASHAEGTGTEANNEAEHAQGKYNLSVKSDVLKDATQFSIGGGTTENNRSNLVEVKKDGSMYVKGLGGFDGKNYSAAKTLQEEIKENEDVTAAALNVLNDEVRENENVASAAFIDLNKKIGEVKEYVDSKPIIPLEEGTGKGSVQTKGQHLTEEDTPAGIPGGNIPGGDAIGFMSHAEGTMTSTGKLVQGLYLEKVSDELYNTNNIEYFSSNVSFIEINGKKYISKISSESTNEVIISGFTLETGHYDIIFIGAFSHAEGNGTESIGYASHAEGNGTDSIGIASHAEGIMSMSSGDFSHAEGDHTETSNSNEHAQGKYNLSVKSDVPSEATQFSIGQGASNEDRSNLVEVKKDGSMYVKGIGGFDGRNHSVAKTLQTAISEGGKAIIGNLEDLQTTNKDNIVAAINELQALLGTVNDKLTRLLGEEPVK